MSLQLGLCSVALRHLDPAAVVACAVDGGAVGIEWEARVHVPPGDIEKARRAAGLSADANLQIPSYGSYIRAGAADAKAEFAISMQSALALGASTIRVWAGETKGLSSTDLPTALSAVVRDLKATCEMAADQGLSVSLEFHPGTFTENATSTLTLFERVNRQNLMSYWQPDYGQPIEAATASLQAMLPVLNHIHVFQWTADHTRLPLDKARTYWARLLSLAEATRVLAPRFALLEFSKGDTEDQVVSDLKTLNNLLAKPNVPQA